MPSFAEELERMLYLKREGKVSPDERCKLVFPRIEARKRIQNTEGKTRLIKQLDTHETYGEFNERFARYIEVTGNPQIAYALMLKRLDQDPEEIERDAAEGL